MTAYSARGESVHIQDNLSWCVMETSFLLHNAQLSVQFLYGDANLASTSSAHRYEKYTENVIFRVCLFFCQRYTVTLAIVQD